MKSLFNFLLISFEAITHPAEGIITSTAAKRKKRSQQIIAPVKLLSPDCVNIRGGSFEKQRVPSRPI